jgi:4'-phosphopantetheinyl transferase
VAALCAEGHGFLSRDERAQYEQYAHPRVAQRFLLGRILLRRVLARCLGVEPGELVFSRSAQGKPLLAEPQAKGLAFNLSHASSQSVLAMARGSCLGVDLEPLERAAATLRIAQRSFSPTERRQLNALGDGAARGALMLWTLKEAVVKALGGAVWDGLEGVQLAIEGKNIRWLAPSSLGDDDHTPWLLAIGTFHERYLLALAAKPQEDVAPGPMVCRAHILGEDGIHAELFQPLATSREAQ